MIGGPSDDELEKESPVVLSLSLPGDDRGVMGAALETPSSKLPGPWVVR